MFKNLPGYLFQDSPPPPGIHPLAMPIYQSRLSGRWLIAGLLLILFSAALANVSTAFIESIPAGRQPVLLMVALLMGAGLVFLYLAELTIHSTPGRRLMIWLLMVGAAMRVLMFFSEPILEVDYHRYLWDGAVTANGINPYAFSPQEISEGALQGAPQALRQLAADPHANLEKINHAYLRSVYPPVTQAAFALAYWLQPWSLTAWRIVLILFDLGTLLLLAALLKRLKASPLWLGIYWLNPLLIKEVFNSGHMDVLLFPFLLLAFLFAFEGRAFRSMTALSLAAGVKLWPVLLLPLLLRTLAGRGRRNLLAVLWFGGLTALLFSPLLFSGMDANAGLNAYGQRWELNDSAFKLLLEGARGVTYLIGVHPGHAQAIARATLAVLLLLLALSSGARKIYGEKQVLGRALLLIAAIFLLSPTQFPWYGIWIIPLLVFHPRRSLLLLTLLLPLYYLRYYFLARGNVEVFDNAIVWLEFLPVWFLLFWEWRRQPRKMQVNLRSSPEKRQQARISVIIPAVNEEESIGKVIDEIPGWVNEIIVVDNGSTDRTVEVARSRGARVLVEKERGYGAACLAGIHVAAAPDIVVFLDGDYSDYPEEMHLLIDPILEGQAEMVIGSRVLGGAEKGALTPQQIFGNRLACRLIRLFWGMRFTDLGPFRAIRYSSLLSLDMRDRNYGWTVEMQIKAAQRRWPVCEAAVRYRKRIGKSKISGTVRGVIGAGSKILATIFVSAVEWYLSGRKKLPAAAGAGRHGSPSKQHRKRVLP